MPYDPDSIIKAYTFHELARKAILGQADLNETYTQIGEGVYMIDRMTNTPYDKHKTADGDFILICQMDDQHLENMLYFLLGKVKQSSIWMGASAEFENLDPVSKSILQDQLKNQSFDSKAQFMSFLGKIGGYLIEFMLRDTITNEKKIHMSQTIAQCVGRSKGLNFLLDQQIKMIEQVSDSEI